MYRPKLTRTRVTIAFGVSVVADILQFPLNGAVATGVFALPGEVVDFILDSVVMVITSFLLGFHWVLLPSFLLELAPGVDLIPTWTGCVAWLVWRRKEELRRVNPQLPDSRPPLP